jgi:transcriptional regulator with XRE-family HTH domain
VGVYENLAVNLRFLCEQKGSISKVCSELGINRQQFSKYLSGDTFPRRATLAKICSYFEISETQLFLEPETSLMSHGNAMHLLMDHSQAQSLAEQILAPQSIIIPDGRYFTYFYPQTNPDWLVRSLTLIKTNGLLTEFRRVTGIAEKNRSPWHLWRGHHRGLILNRRGFQYFMALDQYGSQVPSLAILQCSPSARDLMKGLSIVLTPNGVEACNCVMEKVPSDISLLSVVRQTGAFGIKDKVTPSHIRQLLINM